VSEIGFYHLTQTTLEGALPRLLEKVLMAGHRVVLRAVTPERLDTVDRHLWTYSNASFLPHGTKADGFADQQPIWLTTIEENPNRASVLVLLEGAPLGNVEGFERVLDLFDGNDPSAVSRARGRWKDCRSAGHTLVYWRQTERGGWVADRRVDSSTPSAEDPPPV
jgi:DNA polymerase III subunit chi